MADGLLNKASIILTPTGYKAGTLYNVAPVVEPYEDFDFARASVASRVNSSGLVEMVGRTLGSELVTCGDFSCADPEDDWTLTQATISGGTANLSTTDGSLTSIVQSVTTVGKIYYFSFEVSDLVGELEFAAVGGSGVYSTITSNGTHTGYFTSVTESIEIKRKFGVTNVTASIDNVSVKEVIDTNNIPRISYDSNGDNGHILLEPTSTNLVPYSENFSDSSWTKSELTESLSNINSPDGTQNAYKLTESNSSSKHQIFRSIASYTELTISFFAKKAERSFISVEKSSWGTTVFNLNDGSVVSGNGSVVDFENGWYRCSASYTASPAQSQFYILLMQDGTTTNYQGDGTSGLYLFGVQAEALSYATSYIPTLTGSTETRATETATGAGSADLINSTEGVLYAEIAALANDGTNRRISISDGSDTNRLNLFYTALTNQIVANYRVSNSTVVTINTTDFNITNFNKIAFRWQSGNFVLFINGENKGTNSNTTMISANTLNVLRFEDPNLVNEFYGKCKALAVFNEALSDSELTQLTT